MDTDIATLARGEAGFNARIAERLFNKLPFDRSPELIATPRSEDEVIGIVRAAQKAGQRVAVMSGGHSWIAAPLRDSGVLIDMQAFARIEIDADARTARVGPAVSSRDLAKALAAVGLAFPSGHCGTPGFGGYVLGGGVGLNSGHWKPACYSVRSVRVVTAAGELVVATEADRHDLLWLARGAGPAFPGIVTEFEIVLQDRPADTRLSSWLFDFDDLAAVSRWISEVSRDLPSIVEVTTAGLGPDRPMLPASEGHPDQVVAVGATAYANDLEEARRALAPLAEGPGVPALMQTDLEPIAFEVLCEAFDAEYPQGHRYLADAFWTDRDVEGAVMALQEAFRRAPSGKNNFVALMPANGATLGLETEFGAYSMDKKTLVMPYALWADPALDEANRAWHAEMVASLAPISVGHFISEADLEAHAERVQRSFSAENWQRVLSLRAKWDPEGRFHMPVRGT